jgi:hypothetical protein
MCNLHIWEEEVKHVLQVAAFVALALFAGPALAADAVPGFWTGFLDGFLSLLKLLVSPFIEVTIVAERFGPWAYAIGYYSGVLAFAGVAGLAASSTEAGPAEVRWG